MLGVLKMKEIKAKQTEFSDQDFNKVINPAGILVKKQFYDCNFFNCDFSESNLTHNRFTDCYFKDCNISTVNIQDTTFNNVQFEKCKIQNVNWTSASWPKIRISSPIEFIDCILDNSSFYGLNLLEARIENCHAHHVNFTETNCEYTSFIHSDLFGSIFHKTNLTKADFTNATSYQIDIFLNRIEGATFCLPEAVSLLDSLGVVIIE